MYGPNDRRGVLAAAAALLAGCATVPGTDGEGPPDDGGSASPTRTAGADSTTTAPGGTETTTDATSTGGLDLREANVTAVAVEAVDDGYRFDVTLYHDDEGEDGYANWWQVESLTGERLGRRDLLHAHGTREFTRSETVALSDRTCVVVRGHDQTHGYGGQAMLVRPDDGATRAVRQGPDSQSFAAADCP